MNPNQLVVRKYFALLFVLMFFLVLFLRAFLLQIYHHKKFRFKAESNSVREEWIEPARGNIFDRRGVLLVENIPSYALSVLPVEVEKKPEILEILGYYLGVHSNDLRARMEKNSVGRFHPVRIYNYLNFEQLTQINEELDRHRGWMIEASSMRKYHYGKTTAHLLGYVREPAEEEFNKLPKERYRSGESIGAEGIEKTYENMLKGYPGRNYVKVDVLGRVVDNYVTERNKLPIEGDSLFLTIDIDLQIFTDSLLEGLSGSIIISDAKDGSILCFVTRDAFDPDLFNRSISSENWNILMQDPQKPLFNRSLQGLYPPGSPFKIITALSALENQIILPSKTVFCPGYYQLGNRKFKCWWEKGHGTLNLLSAIEQSCNVYFFTIMRLIDLDSWAKIGKIFQIDTRTGIDLPSEQPSVLPDRAYLDRKYGKRGWTDGNLANQAIGQGDVTVTPMKMNQFVTAIANGSHIFKPKLRLNEPANSTNLSSINKASLEIIREGMYRVVNGENGTANSARLSDREVYGKTGTAQNPHGKDHAWFIGFVELNNTIAAISILIENGGKGGTVASPLAGKIFRYMSERAQ